MSTLWKSKVSCIEVQRRFQTICMMCSTISVGLQLERARITSGDYLVKTREKRGSLMHKFASIHNPGCTCQHNAETAGLDPSPSDTNRAKLPLIHYAGSAFAWLHACRVPLNLALMPVGRSLRGRCPSSNRILRSSSRGSKCALLASAEP
eukprot:scaffold112470_cov21-Tisochrysis_lutea.AAC.1